MIEKDYFRKIKIKKAKGSKQKIIKLVNFKSKKDEKDNLLINKRSEFPDSDREGILKKSKCFQIKINNNIEHNSKNNKINRNIFGDDYRLSFGLNNLNLKKLQKINIFKSKSNNNFLKIDNEIAHHILKGYVKHKGSPDKCRLCLEMLKRSLSNEKKIYDSNCIEKVRKFSGTGHLLNKSLTQFRTKVRMVKLRLINNKKNHSSTNNIHNKKIIYSNYEIYKGDNKISRLNKSLSHLTRMKNKIESKNKNFNLNEDNGLNYSDLMENYKDLNEVNFPAINSYFHKPTNKIE